MSYDDKIKCETIEAFMRADSCLSEQDRQQSSCAKTMRMGVTVAHAVNVNFKDVQGSSMSSIRNNRIKNRGVVSNKIRVELQMALDDNPDLVICVHFDGAKLENRTEGIEMIVKRLPVCITGLPRIGDQVLGIPKLACGTGVLMAKEVAQILVGHKLASRVMFVNSDTTTSNTGHTNGAIVKLEEELGRQLLYTECTKHVDELIISKLIL